MFEFIKKGWVRGCFILLAVATAFTVTISVQRTSRYKDAQQHELSGEYDEAILGYAIVGDYHDAQDKAYSLILRERSHKIAAGEFHALGLQANGTVLAAGDNSNGQCEVSAWDNIISVAAGENFSLGLRADGTVLYAGLQECMLAEKKDIVAIAAGGNSYAGICADSTVISSSPKLDTSKWRNIVMIAVSEDMVVGLRSDGTAVAEGAYQKETSKLRYIVSVAASPHAVICLKGNGTIHSSNLAQGVSIWEDIKTVACGRSHTIGLKKDNTVVGTGSNAYGELDIKGWSNVIEVAAGNSFTLGLGSDGTIRAVGNNNLGQCDVQEWKLF